MVDPVNVFDTHVAARVLDFLDSKTPWQRRLWNIGLALTLRETLEAAGAARVGTLSAGALDALCGTAIKLIGNDPGAGSEQQHKLLQAALKSGERRGDRGPGLRPDVLDFHVIEQQERTLARDYLSRWATALRAPSPPGTERTARAIVSHLLDLGFSSDFLHRWWKYRLLHEAQVRPLAELVDEAHELAHTPPRAFQVLVPIITPISLPPGSVVPEWRSASLVSTWLQDNRSDASGLRQDGGFELTIQALDAGAAAIHAAEAIDRLAARSSLATGETIRPTGRVWVRGLPDGVQVQRLRRGVLVGTLKRERQLYAMQTTARIDPALELLSHLQTSTPEAAVAGGWAAIEALLSEPDDRVGAADRLATLTACSFPRQELTGLSYALRKSHPKIGATLAGVTKNRDRCQIILEALETVDNEPRTLSASDHAAVRRMLALKRRPQKTLMDVRDHIAIAFRRLYRQRNLVLHAGKTDAIALGRSLHTAAPLVGAGIDRIFHAQYVAKLTPLELVARATAALATVGTPFGPSCIGLLDDGV